MWLIANHLQNRIQRNVRETNGLETAATNILRLTNVKKLTDRESEVAALLSEKIGLNKTALKFWMDTNTDSLVIDPRKRLRMKITVFRKSLFTVNFLEKKNYFAVIADWSSFSFDISVSKSSKWMSPEHSRSSQYFIPFLLSKNGHESKVSTVWWSRCHWPLKYKLKFYKFRNYLI